MTRVAPDMSGDSMETSALILREAVGFSSQAREPSTFQSSLTRGLETLMEYLSLAAATSVLMSSCFHPSLVAFFSLTAYLSSLVHSCCLVQLWATL